MDEAAAEAVAHGRLECVACHKTATALHDERLPVVNCAECHAEARAALGEGAHGSRRAQARAPAPTCVGCQDTGYLAFVDEWTAGFDKEATRAAAALKQAQDALRAARRKGRVPPGADLLVKEARDAFLLVKGARAVHNPPAAGALLEARAGRRRRRSRRPRADEPSEPPGARGTPARPARLVGCRPLGHRRPRRGLPGRHEVERWRSALLHRRERCDIVQASRYAVFLGLPTAAWGAGIYAAIGALALAGLPAKRWLAAFLLAVAGVSFSLYLTYLSIFAVGATCAYCLASVGIALALFGLLLLRRPPATGRRSPVRPTRLVTLGVLAAAAAVVVGAAVFAIPEPKQAATYQEALARHLKASGAVFYGAYW